MKIGTVEVDSEALGELLRYGVAGLAANVFAYGVFSFVLFLGAHYAVASLVATVLSAFVSYSLSRYMVFRREGHWWRFVALYVAAYGTHVCVLWLLTSAGVNVYVAALVAIPVVAIASFVLQRTVIFPRR